MAMAIEAPTPVAEVGFTVLSDPRNAVIDIVFVHGLQGHPEDTWKYKLKSAQSPSAQVSSPSNVSLGNKTRALSIFHKFSKHKHLEPRQSQDVEFNQEDAAGEKSSEEKDIFWPRDLLKDDFPNARIITFGYNTNITRGYFPANQGNIFSHARDLLYELESKRRKAVDRDLIFIAHSLGGILVKEVLRRSEIDPDPKIGTIFSSTTGVFFFGTPHRGSKDWVSFGEGIAGVAGRLLSIDTNNQVIHALLPSGPELELCRESFTTQWVKRGNSLTVRTFQESMGITGVRWGGFNQLIVPTDSSSLDHPNQRARTIDEDHRGMVKFKGRDDRVYQMVKVDIEELVENSQVAKRTRDRAIDITQEAQECVKHLYITDPRDDKKRIEETKGGLLEDAYSWVLENSDSQQWRDNQQSRLLWIKGDPGKGKTMLLCGIINELNKSMAKTNLLSYFFCEATDSRINNATAVLRGLLYLLIVQQPSLISHVRKKYNYAGKALFEDVNAWVALSDILINILQDPSLNSAYLILDALDECDSDMSKLLDFIIQQSSGSSCIKWIVSSRNLSNIEERLETVGPKVRLSLELNAEFISTAVNMYIRYKVLQLAQQKKYSDEIRDAVLDYLYLNGNGTFLWVALVCQNLEKVLRWNVCTELKAFPPGLNSLYERMMQQIHKSYDAEICTRILVSTAIVYRPITLMKLTSLVEMPKAIAGDIESLQQIIGLCGSFLSIRQGIIYLVHQSAKDFLLRRAVNDPSESGEAHHVIFLRSLQIMSRTLRRDIYDLGTIGYPANQVEQPDPDPLGASRYSCVYWVEHLCAWNPSSSANHSVYLQSGGTRDRFLRKKFLYWLEALSLCKSLSEGVLSMVKLEALIKGRACTPSLLKLVRDAHRFISCHKVAIENAPLQAYVSALVFSPAGSLIKALFKDEEPRWITVKPRWITVKPGIGDEWSACLHTLEGHSHGLSSVALSHDSARLASASSSSTSPCSKGIVKIWDASSGECLQTLNEHSSGVHSVTFSHDSTQLASASGDIPLAGGTSKLPNGETLITENIDPSNGTIKIWDASSGKCLRELESHSKVILSLAFTHDSNRLASASSDCSIKIWDINNGECLQILKGHNSWVRSVAFSYNSTRLISASDDYTVKIWDASNGECLQTLSGHSSEVWSVAFSHDSTRLASASDDHTIKIWDASNGKCLRTLNGHNDRVNSVAFTHDSNRLASASGDCSIKIWNINNGECLQTLEGHSSWVRSIAFSHDSTRLVSASDDRTIKIWDISRDKRFQTFRNHSSEVNSIISSPDLIYFASASEDKTVKIWDVNNGKCIRTFKGHSTCVLSLAFSHNSVKLASGSGDGTGKSSEVKIWDINSGECLQTFDLHGPRINSVAFSFNSAWLALASYDTTVKIWDVDSGNCFQTLKGHDSEVTSVTFLDNSTRLISASDGYTVIIWDTESGECLQTLWDAESSECLQTLQNTLPFPNMASSVVGLQPPRYQGTGLGSDGAWITYNSEKLVWLPSEYRPSCSAIMGKIIGIGVGSGMVWICNIEL